jgi:hypothetical protein
MNYLALAILSLLAPSAALAQNGYQLLEPLPGLSSGAGVSFAQLLSVFFTLALSLSAAAAVVMITIGGVQYMFSDVPGTKSAGRERIRNAVYGLVLVFAAWLIIRTINPNLLLFNLNIGNVGGSARSACPYLICSTTERQVGDNPLSASDAAKLPPGEGAYVQYREANGKWVNYVFRDMSSCQSRLDTLRQKDPAVAQRITTAGGCKDYSPNYF